MVRTVSGHMELTVHGHILSVLSISMNCFWVYRFSWSFGDGLAKGRIVKWRVFNYVDLVVAESRGGYSLSTLLKLNSMSIGEG